MKKKVLVFCFSLLLVCSAVFFVKKRAAPSPLINIPQILQQIPSQDREKLEYLFVRLLREGFGHVLFGEKPFSNDFFPELAACKRNSEEKDILCSYLFRIVRPDNLKLAQAWATWEKYQHLFPSSRFIFRCSHSTQYDYGVYVQIYLLNKNSFLNTVRDHLAYFQYVLGKQITPEGLLQQFENANIDMFSFLNHHHGLMGMMYGFGRHNAWLFNRRAELGFWYVDNTFTLKAAFHPSQGFDCIDDEIDALYDKLTFFQIDEPQIDNRLFIRIPGFMVDPDNPETHELKKRYAREFNKIVNLYEKGDILTTTLQQLTKS